MILPVKVVPGASSNSISGWLDDALKIRVRAKPEKGAANSAVEKLLAETLELQVNDIRIVSGFSSARKLVRVEGLADTEIREKIDHKLKLGDRQSK